MYVWNKQTSSGNTHHVYFNVFPSCFLFKLHCFYVCFSFLTFKFWFCYLFLHFGTILNIWETWIGKLYYWPNWENCIYHRIFDCSCHPEPLFRPLLSDCRIKNLYGICRFLLYTTFQDDSNCLSSGIFFWDSKFLLNNLIFKSVEQSSTESSAEDNYGHGYPKLHLGHLLERS